MMLEPAHLTAAQQCWITGDKFADKVSAVERDRRKDRRLCATAQQIVGGLPAYVAKARRPADDADLVRIAFTVDVGAGLDQALDYLDRPVLRRPMQRGRVIEPVARCDIEAASQQYIDAIEM